MRFVLTMGLALLAGACAPPDPIRSIDILFPTPDTDVIPLDEDGILRTLVVVDIEGFTVLEEGTADPDSTTEGHWHIYVNDTYRGAVSDGFTTEVEETGITDGQPISITVSLATDRHQDIEDEDGRIDSTIEFIAERTASAQ